MTPCEECQYAYESEDEATIPDKLRTLGRRYTAPLTRFLPAEDGAALLRAHPTPGVWSALEYACHVRDVFLRFQGRLACMLDEDDPTFENCDQDPADVVPAIEAAAAALADAFAAVPIDAWTRAGSRSDGAPFTVATLGQYLVHDPIHHVWNVEQGYGQL